MDFSVKSGSPDKVRTPCVVVAVFQSRKLSAAARALDKATRGSISTIVRRGDIDGKPGSTLVLPITGKLASERVLLVGCGKQGQTTAAEFRRAMSAAASTLQRLEISQASVFLHEIDVKGHSISRKIRHAAEAAGWVLYRFDQLKSGKSQPARLRKLTFCVSQRSDLRAAQHGCAQGSAISAGVRLARELGNLPGNICTPSYLAEQAKSLQKSHGLKTTVLEQKDMEKLGMGALLSVAKGSRQPPKLIVMEHRGAKRADPP
ncbi:MAG: leucyl aminopeptidase, partial [Gammaproteobacteria bacterium]|nr:leucyl aminopeptidase [Gammaproteobacteria bacterium]